MREWDPADADGPGCVAGTGLRRDWVRPSPPVKDVTEGLLSKLGGRTDCDIAGFSLSVFFSVMGVPA